MSVVTTPIATDFSLARFATALEAHCSMQSLVYLHIHQLGANDTLRLYPSIAVYRQTPTPTTTTTTADTVTIPTPDTSLIPKTPAYYCFELEIAVASGVTTLAAPSEGWTWFSGGEPPDATDAAGKTLYISCRLDCTERTVLANCWRVA